MSLSASASLRRGLGIVARWLRGRILGREESPASGGDGLPRPALAPPRYGRPWRDGGYDRAEVEVCPHHPNHDFQIYRVGDLHDNGADPDERMVLCSACLVPRCGTSTEENPCVLPRHHTEWHRFADGTELPAGVDAFTL